MGIPSSLSLSVEKLTQYFLFFLPSDLFLSFAFVFFLGLFLNSLSSVVELCFKDTLTLLWNKRSIHQLLSNHNASHDLS